MKKSAKMVLTSTAVAVTLATIAAQPAFAADKKVLRDLAAIGVVASCRSLR